MKHTQRFSTIIALLNNVTKMTLSDDLDLQSDKVIFTILSHNSKANQWNVTKFAQKIACTLGHNIL
jgi:hypothetical protein